MYPNDTIVAVGSGVGKAGISVIRISGPQASDIGKFICRQTLIERQAIPTNFYDELGASVDSGISIFFKQI